MFSGDCPDWHENTCMRAKWRTENWGTVTEAMSKRMMALTYGKF
ncbi:MAG: hypothetical protein PUK29_05500 [Fibrobacter sp.]|nr:hypothetical protein [Fibrobacter sp.]